MFLRRNILPPSNVSFLQVPPAPADGHRWVPYLTGECGRGHGPWQPSPFFPFPWKRAHQRKLMLSAPLCSWKGTRGSGTGKGKSIPRWVRGGKARFPPLQPCLQPCLHWDKGTTWASGCFFLLISQLVWKWVGEGKRLVVSPPQSTDNYVK